MYSACAIDGQSAELGDELAQCFLVHSVRDAFDEPFTEVLPLVLILKRRGGAGGRLTSGRRTRPALRYRWEEVGVID
jgi:hypothetical protein